MRTRKLALPIAAALAGTAGLAALVPMAHAQTTTTAPAANRQATKQARQDAQRNDYAARLGVTPEKLEQAYKDLAKADIDAAVAAGRITAAQAATLKTAVDQGLGGRGGRGGKGFGLGHLGGVARNADGSRPTAAQIQAARDAREAKFAQLLGVTVDKLRQVQKDMAKARVDAAVAAGRLTAEQAATVKTGIDQGLDIGGFGKGSGGPGGHGGRGGHGLGGHGGRGSRGR